MRGPAVPGLKVRHDLSRLAVLRQMGIAELIGAKAWRFHKDMEQVFKAMQRTADRQRTHRRSEPSVSVLSETVDCW